MDRRNMKEINVSWQLGLFMAALFALPIVLAPVIAALMGDGSVSDSATKSLTGVSLGLVAAMSVAVGARVRQARGERLPGGRPRSGWILRQVAIGLLLCAAGAGILIALVLTDVPRKLAVGGCAVAAGPASFSSGARSSRPNETRRGGGPHRLPDRAGDPVLHSPPPCPSSTTSILR